MKKLYDIFLKSSGVTTDSRAIKEGDLFVALRGERFDGNAYAAAALERGAGAAVVDEQFARGRGLDDRYIVVSDTLLTLQELARHHRKALGVTILAITGTNGKTTTKELAAAVLASSMRVRATEGNLNNHIGVPLTLLKMREGEVGIVEMGASAQGEIALLCEITAPDMGLITNVGRAHLAGFGGEEGVRRAKGELFDYLSKSGSTALVREDDPVLMEMSAERASLNTIKYPATDLESQLVGEYNRHNIAAAAAVGRAFGVPEDSIRAAIALYKPTNHRSQRLDTARNTVIADCYNANPSSMRAAIESFQGDTVILGQMAELGSYSAEEHAAIVAAAMARDVRHIILVGEEFKASAAAHDKAAASDSTRIEYFPDTAALIDHFRTHPLAGRTILVKGSHSTGLERILSEI